MMQENNSTVFILEIYYYSQVKFWKNIVGKHPYSKVLVYAASCFTNRIVPQSSQVNLTDL